MRHRLAGIDFSERLLSLAVALVLQADVLGIFAGKDAWITPQVVINFQNLAKATNKNLELHTFDADHAFANPSNPKYDKVATAKANELVIKFLKENFNTPLRKPNTEAK